MQDLVFWFDFASTYSYPAALRIERAADDAGVPVVWRPFLLGPLLFEQQGLKDSPFNVQAAKGAYMWRDLERVCQALDLPLRKPKIFPQNSLRAARVATVLVNESALTRHVPAFVTNVFLANFAEGRDISDDVVLSELLTRIGVDSYSVMERARSDATKEQLRHQTDEARRKGLFGAPSFTVGQDLFWGNDRLEQAIAFAQATGSE